MTTARLELFRDNYFSFRERISIELERLVFWFWIKFQGSLDQTVPLLNLTLSFRLFLRWLYKKDRFTRVPSAVLNTAPSVGQTSTVLYKTSPSALSYSCLYYGTEPVVYFLLCEYNKQSYTQLPLARLQTSKGVNTLNAGWFTRCPKHYLRSLLSQI